MSKYSNLAINFLATLLLALLLLVLLGRFVDSGLFGLTGVQKIGYSLIEWLRSDFWVDVAATFSRVIIGFVIALTLAMIVGVSTSEFSAKLTGVVGILNFLRAVTPVALAPFFLAGLGINEFSKIALIAWGAFFPIWVSCHLGLRTMRQSMIESVKLLELGGIANLWHFYTPAAFRGAYPGCRIAIAVGFILAYISETLGAEQGVGARLSLAYDTNQFDNMASSLLVLGLAGFLSDRLFVMSVNFQFPWANRERMES